MVPGVMMSFVTTEPAPITTSSTMRTGMMVAAGTDRHTVGDYSLAPQLLARPRRPACRTMPAELLVQTRHLRY
jgi:hypothetical protein